MQLKDQLLAKIEDRTACIGVVGLGYVGLPLALEFARAGFKVIGYDVSDRVISSLMAGKSHIQDVPSVELARINGDSNLRTFSDGLRVLRTIVAERQRASQRRAQVILLRSEQAGDRTLPRFSGDGFLDEAVERIS